MGFSLKSILSKKDKVKKGSKKAVIREWIDALVWAVSAAVIIRWAIFTPYKIPTPSMEHTLLVGDYLVVSKLSYGPKTPATPLQLPLASNIYLGWLELPVFRFPGFSEIKNNDVVVFHYPGETAAPSDMRTPYIKRCIGIAGDSLEVRKKHVYINGKEIEEPVDSQTNYIVYTVGGSKIRSEFLLDLGINLDDMNAIEGGYRMRITKSTAKKLNEMKIVKSVEEVFELNPNPETFPHKSFKFGVDNYGPIYIPKKGDVIEMSPRNILMYKDLITIYDGNDNAVFIEGGKDGENSKILIDDQEITSYIVKQDYFFMMGDNRHNSLDSRFFGFVPKDHVIGKATYTWWSVNENESWINPFKKIRWNKILHKIE